MLLDTLILTFLGMGVVFLFLFLMIGCMNALRAMLPILERISPEAARQPSPAAAPKAPGAAAAAAVALAYSNSGRNS